MGGHNRPYHSLRWATEFTRGLRGGVPGTHGFSSRTLATRDPRCHDKAFLYEFFWPAVLYFFCFFAR
jgi:hypothetical protein